MLHFCEYSLTWAHFSYCRSGKCVKDLIVGFAEKKLLGKVMKFLEPKLAMPMKIEVMPRPQRVMKPSWRSRMRPMRVSSALICR